VYREDRLVPRTGERGQKGLGERAFGEDAPEEVGQLERDEKDVAVDVRPEDRSGHQVPDETENARKEDAEAVGEYGTEHSGTLFLTGF